ncbi:MAG: quinolinate synthase [Chloroflexi bacterium CG15_BIG_FIL_POST_REV_8_21_14_020_46_15]|nr:MAG: quinolinate synthase [Dehalococcoidia bacterium CG2_30_46_19]PIW40602.1 MAG: quinolinate synthase [Chloroflexi bacterium CG15_BIG_FIL_POST_REV_8_21_14_020_46_15]
MTKNRDTELIGKILDLKKKRNAVILAHNYQLGEVQDIADFIGDSLGLSQNAAKTDAAVIVFCGVRFMAETASILCPDKIVLLPDINAGCPMANMITAEKLREKKKEVPAATVVCYVNSTAEVKAESDICCTSANAVKVVESLDAQEILFVPDQYLGHYISTKTGKKMLLWPGFCPTHVRIQPEHIVRLREEYPQAKVVVHPECRPEVIALADEVLSTGGMCRYARRSEVKEMIVGTEMGIIHRLKKENPDKRFIPVSEQAICPNMKLITLEKVLWSLEEMTPEVKVPEDIRLKAKSVVDKMLMIGRG